MKRLLIANRGEIAIRIARTASLMGIETVAVAPQDDRGSLHLRRVDRTHLLPGRGARAYLDIEAIVSAAVSEGCEAVHPGYGFLSENAAFADACREAGLIFVGPEAAHLALFGDKARARALAQENKVPVPEGTSGNASLDEIRSFFASLPPGDVIMIKAVSGGGGRGMRVVESEADIESAFARCRSEAEAAFGQADVYAERLIRQARHVEVQVVGDGTGSAIHLWERDCTLQRRHQKLVEIAPARSLHRALRARIHAAALRMAQSVKYSGLATFEFLVEPDADRFSFMEVNPRLQVEHTVTEEVTGIDLVEVQLRLAEGEALTDLDLAESPPEPSLNAVQLRINAEDIRDNGDIYPASGSITVFEPSTGPGVRVDSSGYTGFAANPAYDTLLAKLIVTAKPERMIDHAARALAEFRLQGIQTNIPLLAALLESDALRRDAVDTGLVEREIAGLMASPAARDAADRAHQAAERPDTNADRNDPAAEMPPAGMEAVRAMMAGVVAAIEVTPGQDVARGAVVAVIEAMKAEIPLVADCAGTIVDCRVAAGDMVVAGQIVAVLEARSQQDGDDVAAGAEVDLDAIRPDLRELLDRRAEISDDGRPDAVRRRHERGLRTARENIADLCDPGSFVEYGAHLLAAQRGRRDVEELRRLSPADGTVTGTATVNAPLFPDGDTRCGVMHYDYTVFAGTQGFAAHRKMDRMFDLAIENRLPFVLFAEGGGGRPGDTDYMGPSGLDLRTFRSFGRLAGMVPLVGVASGRCFAGNAALLGCCHVVIATENSTIGMAGPAMIEAGGLGSFTPEEVGPVDVHVANGVVDLRAADEAEAVALAKRYLSYFQGNLSEWQCADQRRLRHVLPANRLRAYEMRQVIELIADEGSVLELRRGFGRGIITALLRIEGRPVGVVANNPLHLGGAIDADSSDKATRFLQLCDAFDLPVVSLCDTPGFMVGPDSEREATVRHFARLFLTAGRMESPFVTVVLRKAYGLGAQAMAGGAFLSGQATIAWPSGEMGPMGLEGAVRLAYRKEAEAIADPEERAAYVAARIDELYAQGKALNVASYMEIDDVIDPAETRDRLVHAISMAPPRKAGNNDRRKHVDAW